MHISEDKSVLPHHSVVNVEEDAYAHLRGSLLKGNIATGDGAAVRIAKVR